MQGKFPRLARSFLRGILGLAGVVVLLVVAIQIEQRVFRYRAERLYEDVMTIQLRRTTFEQLEPMLQRWSANVSHGEPCFKQHCDLTITVRHPIFMPEWGSRLFEALLNVYRKLGGRVGVALARITVRNGFVWGKNYVIGFDVAPVKNDGARTITYFSEFRVSTIPRIDSSRFIWPGTRKNPEFELRWPSKCFECVDVKFTPYADAADIRRLSDFNFSCLASWRPCRERQDIAPAAAAELSKQMQSHETEQAECDLASVRILARDTQNVGVFDVIASRRNSLEPFDESRTLTVRLVQRVKRTLFWSLGEKVEVEIAGGMPALAPLGLDGNVRPGERVILLFLRRPDWNRISGAGAEMCGVVPYSEENLDAVRSGVAEDDHVEPLVEYEPQYQPRTGLDMPEPAPMMPAPPHSRR